MSEQKQNSKDSPPPTSVSGSSPGSSRGILRQSPPISSIPTPPTAPVFEVPVTNAVSVQNRGFTFVNVPSKNIHTQSINELLTKAENSKNLDKITSNTGTNAQIVPDKDHTTKDKNALMNGASSKKYSEFSPDGADEQNETDVLVLNFNKFNYDTCDREFGNLYNRIESLLSGTDDDDDKQTEKPQPKHVFHVDFISNKLICLLCGMKCLNMNETRKRWEMDTCIIPVQHNICIIDFKSKSSHCRGCGSKFHTLNEAVEHHENNIFPPQTRETVCQPDDHTIIMNFNIRKFVCQACCGKSFDTIEEVGKHMACFKTSKSKGDKRITFAFSSNKLFCLKCGETFDTMTTAAEHSKKTCTWPKEHFICLDFESGTLVCRICGTKFDAVSDAMVHWKSKTFSNLDVHVNEFLAKHRIYIDFDSKEVSCCNCNRNFMSMKDAADHWETETISENGHKISFDFNSKPKKMICLGCEVNFDSVTEAVEHWIMNHPTPTDHKVRFDFSSRSMVCRTCGKIFSATDLALEHLKKLSFPTPDKYNGFQAWHYACIDFDSQKLSCNICSMKFETLREAENHKKRHIIRIDFKTNSMVCHRCHEEYDNLNSAAKHWDEEMFPLNTPGVKISSKHEIDLDFCNNNFICLNSKCGKTFETFEQASKHWKHTKKNEFCKKVGRTIVDASLASFF